MTRVIIESILPRIYRPVKKVNERSTDRPINTSAFSRLHVSPLRTLIATSLSRCGSLSVCKHCEASESNWSLSRAEQAWHTSVRATAAVPLTFTFVRPRSTTKHIARSRHKSVSSILHAVFSEFLKCSWFALLTLKARFPLPEFTARVHGPIWGPVNSGAFFDTGVDGPSWRVSKNAPEFTGRELGPWTRVVETGL